jgi:hypothetical protein
MHATVISDEAECDRIWALADRVFAPYATYRQEAAEGFFGRLSRQRPKTGGYRRPARKLDEPEQKATADTSRPLLAASAGRI